MDMDKLKQRALVRLKDNYILIIIALLIYGLIEALLKTTSILIYNKNMDIIFGILVTGLLYEGLMQMVIKTARGKETNIMDLFNKTDLFWKSSAITIIISAVTGVCGLLGLIAGRSLSIFVNYQSEINVALSAFMILVGIVLCIAIATFYIILMILFSQVYYILYDNEKMPVLDIFSKSMDIMEERKLEYIIFNLNFICWGIVAVILYYIFFINTEGLAILGIFAIGIIAFWVIPYMLVANVNYYDQVKKQDGKPIKLMEDKTENSVKKVTKEIPKKETKKVTKKPVKKTTKKNTKTPAKRKNTKKTK